MRQRQPLERSINDLPAARARSRRRVTLIELGEAEDDDATIAEGEAALKQLDEEAQRRSVEALLSGEADGNDTYVEVHAGAGGTESQDWASMLARMYMRWARAARLQGQADRGEPGRRSGHQVGDHRDRRARTPTAG